MSRFGTLTINERTAAIDSLIEAGCWKENDRLALNSVPDQSLVNLIENCGHKRRSLTANSRSVENRPFLPPKTTEILANERKQQLETASDLPRDSRYDQPRRTFSPSDLQRSSGNPATRGNDATSWKDSPQRGGDNLPRGSKDAPSYDRATSDVPPSQSGADEYIDYSPHSAMTSEEFLDRYVFSVETSGNQVIDDVLRPTGPIETLALERQDELSWGNARGMTMPNPTGSQGQQED